MSRILAIDYGEKRCGIAVTDPMQLIASGLTTVTSDTLVSFLKKYFANEDVELVVVGKPKQMNNEDLQSEVYIGEFLRIFEKEFPDKKYVRIDERFTSKMAFQTMINSGLKKKQRQNKALVDEISATLILQSYLAQK